MHSHVGPLKASEWADLKENEHQYLEDLIMIYQSDYYSNSIKHFVCESVSLNRILQKDPSAKLSPYQLKELCELILIELYSNNIDFRYILTKIRSYNNLFVNAQEQAESSCAVFGQIHKTGKSLSSIFENLQNTTPEIKSSVIKAYCEYFYKGALEILDDHLFSCLHMHFDEWMNNYRNQGLFDAQIDGAIDDYKLAMWEE